MTEPLSSRAGRRALWELSRADRPVLFLDVDGTLAPIVEKPEEARVPAGTGHTIATLRRLGATVVLVSGRSALAAAEVAGQEADAILGNHGAEILHGGVREPWVGGNEDGMDAAATRLQRSLEADWPGVWLEHKQLSLAVHHRLDRAGAEKLIGWVRDRLGNPGIGALAGRRVIDVRYRNAHKGLAVRHWLTTRHPGGVPEEAVLYAGDDTTDEDAFRILGPESMTVLIGKRVTAARFRTPSPATFARWLERLSLLLLP